MPVPYLATDQAVRLLLDSQGVYLPSDEASDLRSAADLDRAFDRVLELSWLRTVARTEDADLRSHMITLTYYAYGAVLDAWIHGATSYRRRVREQQPVRQVNNNWFGFATWATVSVARNIRMEQPPQRLGSLPASVRRRIGPAVIHARAGDGQRISRALAWGQRLIFLSVTNRLRDELGLTTLAGDEIDRLSSWDGKKRLRQDHKDALDRALGYYARAQALDGPARAQAVLAANILITAVEQDLVDDAVRAVVDYVPQRSMSIANTYISELGERLGRVPREFTQLRLLGREARARALLDAVWSRILTDQVFVMTLPAETLRVGRDLPYRSSSDPFFPDDLCDRCLQTPLPEAPDVQDELKRLLSLFDRSRGSGTGTAASDWRRFDERMNWAVNLMRSRQQDPTVCWAPYRLEDVGRIASGQLPWRGGDPTDLEVLAPLGPPG